jgi:large subunit ribosomal protein L24
MQKIRVNDTVQVLAGKDKGKKGKVLKLNFKSNRVTVEGVNVFKKANRPTQQQPEGGIGEIVKPLHLSNVKVVESTA